MLRHEVDEVGRIPVSLLCLCSARPGPFCVAAGLEMLHQSVAAAPEAPLWVLPYDWAVALSPPSLLFPAFLPAVESCPSHTSVLYQASKTLNAQEFKSL